MGHIKLIVGEYTLNQVDYPRSSKHGDYDIVCQVKLHDREVCHCTWHPDGSIHCKKNNVDISPSECPCINSKECLRD